jgi:hypothetical protein
VAIPEEGEDQGYEIIHTKAIIPKSRMPEIGFPHTYTDKIKQ